jgi:hypothetical protein
MFVLTQVTFWGIVSFCAVGALAVYGAYTLYRGARRVFS